MDFEIFQQLGVALALSALIGIERERRYKALNSKGFGGVRTYTLIGLLGALAFILSEVYKPFFAVISVGFLALVVAGYVMTTKKNGGVGSTSEVAAILVYLIGILSAMGEYLLATVVTLALLLILHFRDPLHYWATHLKREELFSTVEFIVIAFVILPLLPNESFGPYGFFNPYLVWLMVVFISGISFVSYIAIKIFGQRKGITLTGFLAGFISSTALTFSFSGESKKNRSIVNPYVLAVVIASSAMFFRVLLEVFVLNRELIEMVYIPLLTMGVIGIVCVAFLWQKKEKQPKDIRKNVLEVKSPFNLKPALKFAVFFALILLLSEYASANFGNKGIYLTSFFSGLLDVDAITVSMANLAKNGLPLNTASVAIAIAAITNTVVKAAIFLLFAGRQAALRLLGIISLVSAGGVISLFFI